MSSFLHTKVPVPVFFLAAIFLSPSLLLAQEKQGRQRIEDDVPFEIKPADDTNPKILLRYFRKEVDVFGVRVLATAKTPDQKMLHAAQVLAQYLDNDADGRPDNEKVIRSMRKNRATLIMFATEKAAEETFKKLESDDPSELDGMILQSLYGEETHPNGASKGIFDASLEEVLHLITRAGFAHAYPKVFGEAPGSKLTDAMDRARGGRFRKVPRKYPEDAWYTYYDRTCDYECQATEYIYWGLTSLLGGQDFPGRGKEIGREWRLNTPEKFKKGDKLLFELLTNTQYRMPTQLPDGKYRPKKHSN